MEKYKNCFHNMQKIITRNLPLLFILILAALLRLWGIQFGLPQMQIGDEGALIAAALYSGANWLKPFRPMYGQFVPYFLLIEYGVYFVLGKIFGIFKSPFDVLISFIKDPRELLLIGRFTMAMFGVATVWLVYYMGRQFYNKRIGLLAAIFLSFAFLHTKESHYLKESNPAAFFTLACFYFTVQIFTRGAKLDYFLAGVFLGLGLGAKYEPILMIVVLIIAHLLRHKKIIFKNVKYLLLGIIPIIFLTFPYLFFNPLQYWQMFLAEYKLTTTVYSLYLQGKPVWWWFLFVHIPQGLGNLLFATAILGFFVSLVNGRFKREYLFLPVLPVIFLLTIDYWQKFHNARYALLILPYLTLAGAVSVDWFARFITSKYRQSIFVTVVVISLVAPSVVRTVKFNTVTLKPDTRQLSKKWIETNIPAGSRVLVESMVRPEYPANINTPLFLDKESIQRYLIEARASGYPGFFLTALKTAVQGKIGYDLVDTARVDVTYDRSTRVPALLTSAQYWVNQNVTYLIITSWHTQPEPTPEFQKSITETYDLIKEFQPNPQFQSDPHFVQMDYSALDRVNIFSHELIFGPVIQIYKIKDKAASKYKF